MKSAKKWEDWFNHERLVNEGTYCFHRYYHTDENAYTISTEQNQYKFHQIPFSIKDYPPIAIGITAFFIYENDMNNLTSIKSKIEQKIDYNTIDIYKDYFEHCFKYEQRRNKKLPNPRTPKIAETLFIPIHIQEEELKLKESKNFFEECETDEEDKTNSQLYEYADGYIKWLKEEVNNIDILINGMSEFILVAIFNKYKDDFINETKKTWIKRFYYQSKMKISPIDVVNNATEGTNRLKLLAILSFVQSNTGNDFDFEKFVNDRFGIKNFQKAKSFHKNKYTYIEVMSNCNSIAKNMT